MDPKILLLVPGLVGGCHADQARPSVHLPKTPPAAPVRVWPIPEDHPESDHPAHEDASQMYRGMV